MMPPCSPILLSPFPSPLSSLPSLLRQITDLDGDFRVRLSSIEAAEVTPELVGLMAERRDRICPHLHLPLQSGSNAVLRRMNRRGTVEEFVERCRTIRAALDRPALTTDVIVGFPGETEADFAATCGAVEEVGFGKVHVFRFSPRQGTPAAEMSDRNSRPDCHSPRRRNWEGWVNRCGRGIFENFLAGLCRFWSRARFLVGRAGWAALLTFMPRWLCPAGRSCSVSSPTLSVSRLKTAGFLAGRVVTTDLFAA